MWKRIIFLVCFLPFSLKASEQNLTRFFLQLSNLEFDKARQIARVEKDSLLRFEMLQLTEILFYEGQKDKSIFKLSEFSVNDRTELLLLRILNQGYISLFYDQVKGNAYKHFYQAYRLSKESDAAFLIKPCILAILRYYNFEIAQNSDAYLPYLKHFESLQSDLPDRVWLTIYKMIFYSKNIGSIDAEYFKLSSALNEFEKSVDPKSFLLCYIFREKALKFEMEKDLQNAIHFYKKTIHQAKDYPFLRDHRFFSYLKLLHIETEQRNFQLAGQYVSELRKEFDKADTLRSAYFLNLYSAFLLRGEKKYDSAFNLLLSAYRQEYYLDFRRNTLEINRLNVELETQEKENANLRLRQNRLWLLVALSGVALLCVAIYLAYANQRAKNKIQLKEKEMQSMKMEKLLKDQEMLGIDAMIEGQDRERQRIASDLHDNLGSLLAALKFNFHSLKTKKGVIESEQQLLIEKTDELLSEAYQKVRAMAHAKNAGVNAKEGLLPAVRNFASKVSVFNQLTIEVEEHGMDERLDNSLEILIFRIIQELLTNVIKHAQASEITIHLTRHEASINLMVEDNGAGFDISHIKPENTMGLYSIQRKIESLGGQVTIDSIAKKGTSIIIDIPLT